MSNWKLIMIPLRAGRRACSARGLHRTLLWVAASLVLLCVPAAARSKGKAVILGINDVYRIEGVEDGQAGGMARVRALRAQLERSAPDMLFLHAGDFLSPSLLGRTYAGAQMIDVMNVMDGNPAAGAFDRRMLVTFGNHEFDDTHCGRDGPLARLIAASEFTWLTSNLDFSRCERLRPLAGIPNIAASQIVASGGLRIGIFAVTLAYPSYAAVVQDPIASACRQIAELRAKGVDVVVGLTHLKWRVDLELLGLGPEGRPLATGDRTCHVAPDLIIGGHDHEHMALPSASPRLFKADADAVSAWVVEIEKGGRGELRIKGRLEQLDHRRAPDPLVHRVAAHWLREHDERYCLGKCLGLAGDAQKACLKHVDNGACLKQAFVRAATPVDTEEHVNRSYETGFGDWIADQVREAGRADVAFLNAGSIRINHNLPAGTVITRRHLEQMFPFKARLVVREVSGQTLWRALEHAVEQRGEGPWAHFSGMAVQLAEAGQAQKVAKALVRRRDGSVVEIGPRSNDRFTVASAPFVLADGDGHGFGLCPEGTGVPKCIEALEADPRWPAGGEEGEITGLVAARLSALEPARGLVLKIDRRLCDRGQTDCLIAKWQ